jgi:NTP pyrophosphatase (non-canonical NTP hydrolase)
MRKSVLRYSPSAWLSWCRRYHTNMNNKEELRKKIECRDDYPITITPEVLMEKYKHDYKLRALEIIQEECHQTAVDKGWWDKPVEEGTSIALMHSELSEALEALRHGNPPDDKIPEYSGVEAELADVMIRIFDFAGGRNYNVIGAMLAKMEMNKTRSHKHGGKHF